MKRMAVVCSNLNEWRFFADTLQWNLSKQNKPYKRVAKAIIDKHEDTFYFYLSNNVYTADQSIYCMYSDDFSIDKVIGMCDIESSVSDYLERWIR